MSILYALLLVTNLTGSPTQADIQVIDHDLTAEDCFKQEDISFLDQDNTKFVATVCKPMGTLNPLPLPSVPGAQSPN